MLRKKTAKQWLRVMLGLVLAQAWTGLGCRQKEPQADSNSDTEPASNSVEIVEDLAPQLVAVDEQDAADAPFYLPRTDTLRDWIKTHPVRTGPGRTAKQMTEPSVGKVLETFRIERISVCTYEQPELRVEVLAVEATTPEDAFGIFSLLADGDWIFGGDRSIRAKVEAAASICLGWQGRCVIRLRGEGRINPDAEKDLADLLGQIVFYIPATEPPLLAQAIPPAKRSESRVWTVRDLHPLCEQYNDQFHMIDPSVMNERLGLTSNVLFSVARVRQEPDQEDELIWLAQYPDAAAARDAYKRYRKALAEADDGRTVLLEPRGVYFVGSWSDRSEPLQRMLNELHQALPADDTRP